MKWKFDIFYFIFFIPSLNFDKLSFSFFATDVLHFYAINANLYSNFFYSKKNFHNEPKITCNRYHDHAMPQHSLEFHSQLFLTHNLFGASSSRSRSLTKANNVKNKFAVFFILLTGKKQIKNLFSVTTTDDSAAVKASLCCSLAASTANKWVKFVFC